MGIDLNINDLLIAGVLACLFMDTFQRLLFITLQIPPSNWGMVGRWTVYAITRGKVINPEIDNLPAISGETSLGWLVHYAVGIGYALVYFVLRDYGWLDNSFYSGALFGIASVVVPCPYKPSGIWPWHGVWLSDYCPDTSKLETLTNLLKFQINGF